MTARFELVHFKSGSESNNDDSYDRNKNKLLFFLKVKLALSRVETV